jgi:hypothetical protein
MATITQYILDVSALYNSFVDEITDEIYANDCPGSDEYDQLLQEGLNNSSFAQAFGVTPDEVCFSSDSVSSDTYAAIYESGAYEGYWHQGNTITISEPTADYFVYKGQVYELDDVTLTERLMWLMEDCASCRHAVWYSYGRNNVYVIEDNGERTVLPLYDNYPPCYFLMSDSEFPANYPQSDGCPDFDWD